jgi:hypothetical protein
VRAAANTDDHIEAVPISLYERGQRFHRVGAVSVGDRNKVVAGIANAILEGTPVTSIMGVAEHSGPMAAARIPVSSCLRTYCGHKFAVLRQSATRE